MVNILFMNCRDFFSFSAISPAGPVAPPAPEPAVAPECSHDRLFGGRLGFRQPKAGYRFSVDAVLLAHFVRPRPGRRVLDLGCGCGVVGQILAWRAPDCAVLGIEKQPLLAELAGENAAANGLADRVSVVEGDIRRVRELIPPESFDLALCNPPYYREGTGRLKRNADAARARHDLDAGLEDFIRAAAFSLKSRGRAAFIFPADGQAALQARLRAARLMPKRLRFVYGHPEADRAALVLVEAMKNGGESCVVPPPLYVHDRRDGAYTEEMRALYQEASCWPKF